MTGSTQIKNDIKKCKCGATFIPIRRNGLPVSKYCPNCTRSIKYEKAKKAQEKQRNKSKSTSSSKAKPYAKTPLQNARDRADAYFSKYIRLLYADDNGYLTCYTHKTPRPFHYSQVDNGHYISRKVLSVRYDIRNCRPQCVFCNRGNYGEEKTFRQRLIQEIGEQEVLKLEAKAKEQQKESIEFYNAMSDKYRILLRQLILEKNIL